MAQRRSVGREDAALAVWWRKDRYFCLADGKVLDPRPGGRGGAVDLAALVRSALRSGEHWIFTCTCGAPCCGGYGEPVRVVHDGARIHWHLSPWDPVPWMTFPAWTYREVVRRAVEAALEHPAPGDSPHGILGMGTEGLRAVAAPLLTPLPELDAVSWPLHP